MSTTVVARVQAGRRVLKIHGRGCDEPEPLRFSLELQEFLAQRGYPTPRPLRALDGELLVSSEGGLCALFDWVDGQALTPGNVAQLHAAAGMLARFHELASRFQPSRAVNWPPMSGAVFGAKRSDLRQVLEAAAGGNSGPLSLGELHRIADLLATSQSEFASLPLSQLPRCTIHGDYRAQNVLFSGDVVAAALDLDFSRPAERLFDLAYALVFFQSVIAPDPMSLSETIAFLRAYHERAPLTEQERAAVPAFLKLAWLRGMILWLRIHYVDKASPNAGQWIRSYWSYPEWLAQNAERLCER
jgi:homoserine kinase type II